MCDDHDEDQVGPAVSPAHQTAAGLPTNGTSVPSQTSVEMAQIAAYGECRKRSRLAGRPLCHDWHPSGSPIQTPQSVVLSRVCCYCAPEGVTILVRTTLSDQQIEAESGRHGSRLVFEQVVLKGSGLVLPGQEGFVMPPGGG